MLARFLAAVAAMVAVVAASNFLVQYPVAIQLGSVNLGDILTWGAFTYPVAFLVTDLTNRAFGPARARLVVIAGFAVAVLLSIWLATPRIAIASGTAFLVAQFLDISIFHRLRHGAWWQAPIFSSLAFPAPLLGVGPEVELWVSLGLGDFLVKLLLAVILLAPYKTLRGWLAGRGAVAA